MVRRIFIKQDDFVFMRKISRAKNPKYNINNSVLMRDVKDSDKYEIDIALTNAGMQDLINKILLALKKRFDSVTPTAYMNHYSYDDKETHVIAENQLFEVTINNDIDCICFEVTPKHKLNKQTAGFIQKWYEVMTRTVIKYRKPIYDGFARKINNVKELDAVLKEPSYVLVDEE